MKKHEQVLLYVTLILTIAYISFGLGRAIGNQEAAEFAKLVCRK